MYLVAGAVAAAGLGAVFAVITDRHCQRTDWRDAAHVLTASATAPLVVLDPASAELPLSPYVQLSDVPHRSVLSREIDVVRFLLTTQGAGESLELRSGCSAASAPGQYMVGRV